MGFHLMKRTILWVRWNTHKKTVLCTIKPQMVIFYSDNIWLPSGLSHCHFNCGCHLAKRKSFFFLLIRCLLVWQFKSCILHFLYDKTFKMKSAFKVYVMNVLVARTTKRQSNGNTKILGSPKLNCPFSCTGHKHEDFWWSFAIISFGLVWFFIFWKHCFDLFPTFFPAHRKGVRNRTVYHRCRKRYSTTSIQ